MRFTLQSLAIFLFVNNTDGQDITGPWRWTNNAADRSFEIELGIPTPDDGVFASYDFVGEHCGVYYVGGRIDCTEAISIFLRKEKENTFQGTVKSAYSDSISPLDICPRKAANPLESN
ncbi:hypothetical protein GCM10009119_23300 [Algoriphagus jejuensis]|uniref:Uncharacterized protein n=1 Tax=Algoriphagus jejuensis TaxID=419934 RepID=A0ABP3YHF2_9BACT